MLPLRCLISCLNAEGLPLLSSLQGSGRQHAWRPIQEDARAAAQALAKQLRVAEGKVHSVQDGRLDILQAAYILPLHVGHLQRAFIVIPQLTGYPGRQPSRRTSGT